MDTVRLPKSVRAGVATDTGRYAIRGVLLQPGPKEGTVSAISTDGHQLTVVKLGGTLSDKFLVPPEALPTTKSGVVATFTGQNGARTVSTVRPNGKRDVTDIEEDPGTFPSISDVVPECPDDVTVLCIDAAILLKAARALTTDPDAKPLVTLYIDTTKPEQKRGIPIAGADGFGVVMPYAPDTHGRNAYTSRRDAFLGPITV